MAACLPWPTPGCQYTRSDAVRKDRMFLSVFALQPRLPTACLGAEVAELASGPRLEADGLGAGLGKLGLE